LLRQQCSEGSAIASDEGRIVSRSGGGRGAIQQTFKWLGEIVGNV
jgi:hypothetical protein